MFTLTGIHHPGDEVGDLLRLEENFRELRKKLKRKYPEFKYFAVKEFSPNGNWHYHGLWNIFIEFTELVSLWKEISGAHRVYLRSVYDGKGAVNYIFKYVFKAIHNPRELELLYTNDKRKFSSSKGLLSAHKIPNPYISEFGTTYSREELQQTLLDYVRNTDLSINDFHSVEYPYFDDMMEEIFHFVFNEHPPNLWEVATLAKIPA